MTRRELAAFLVAAPGLAAAPAVVQTAGAPEPAPPPAQPNDQFAAAKDDLRQAAAQLAKAKLDITTEPAFRFKA
jgi:hypothetical protein